MKWRTFMYTAQRGDWEAISHPAVGGPKLIGNKFYYSPFHEWQPRDARKQHEALVAALGTGPTDAHRMPLVTSVPGRVAPSDNIPYSNHPQYVADTVMYASVVHPDKETEQTEGKTKTSDGVESKTKGAHTKSKVIVKAVRQRREEELARRDSPPLAKHIPKHQDDTPDRGAVNQSFQYGSDSSVDWGGQK